MVDSEDGRPVFAEVVNKGKRRDIMVQCALEACRILDAHGVLRASTHERHEVKKRNWAENDFYDSDDDTYLDRTGTIEAKRMRRIEKYGSNSNEQPQNKVHTFETLVSFFQLRLIVENVIDVTARLQSADLLAAQDELDKLELKIKASQSHVAKMNSLDTLDEYMQGMKSGQEVDATTRRKMKMRTIELKKEIARIEKMREAARPAEIKLNTNAELSCRKANFLSATSRFGFAAKVKTSNSVHSASECAAENSNPLLNGADGPENSSKDINSLVVKVR